MNKGMSKVIFDIVAAIKAKAAPGAFHDPHGDFITLLSHDPRREAAGTHQHQHIVNVTIGDFADQGREEK